MRENGERGGEPVRPSWPELGGWSGVWPDRPAADPAPAAGLLELFGGPLDGRYVDQAALSREESTEGVALASGRGGRYPGGRSLYLQDPARPGTLRWAGDLP